MEGIPNTNFNSKLVQEQYKVTGMTCASCAMSLESYLKSADGVTNVMVNYPNQSVLLSYDTDKISPDKIKRLASEIGYQIITEETNDTKNSFEASEANRLKRLKSKLIFSALFSLPVFCISMFFMGWIPSENWVLLLISAPVLAWGGSSFFSIAWMKMKHFSANMDTLVALSTGIAFGFSVFNTVYPEYFLKQGLVPHVYYESAVIIITLILLGRYLEEKAKGKTSSAIKKLMGLTPQHVTAIRNGEECTIKLEDIVKGDLLLLKPGDKVPVDGVVKKGTSYIDESMISGEPIPLAKTKKDPVWSGTINQKGSLRIIARKVGKDTLLAQIIRLVEQAQASKPSIQKLVDKVAGIFVPIIIGISVITFLLWYFLGPEPSFSYAILGLITVLIIACPCALGLATPTALMVGIGKGAQQGILIKDAQALETAYKINTLILDKTGTITQGKPVVSEVHWHDETNSLELSSVLLALESVSEHPLAEAIVKHLEGKDTKASQIEHFESITGRGVRAKYNDELYLAGNEQFIRAAQVDIPTEMVERAETLKAKAQTIIYFASAHKVKAILALADQVKSSSVEAIQQLQQQGIEVIMLTGDNEQTAAAIAKKVGIQTYKGNTMPSEKGDFVKQMQEKGKVVAMAGDGINDSNALAQADIGIAMGSGTDIAMDSAGITLMQSDLGQINEAIKLSKATMKTIRQNLFWAFIYNIIAIPIAAGILYPINGFLLNPMIAGAAMAMSSISVLMNSLRLQKR